MSIVADLCIAMDSIQICDNSLFVTKLCNIIRNLANNCKYNDELSQVFHISTFNEYAFLDALQQTCLIIGNGYICDIRGYTAEIEWKNFIIQIKFEKSNSYIFTITIKYVNDVIIEV